MELAFLVFWVIMIIWALSSFMWSWPGSAAPRYAMMGTQVMLFVLLFLLGWKVFGFGH